MASLYALLRKIRKIDGDLHGKAAAYFAHQRKLLKAASVMADFINKRFNGVYGEYKKAKEIVEFYESKGRRSLLENAVDEVRMLNKEFYLKNKDLIRTYENSALSYVLQIKHLFDKSKEDLEGIEKRLE